MSNENADDEDEGVKRLLGYQCKFYSLLEKYPMIILPCPTTKGEDTPEKKENDRLSNFLFALFCLNGIYVTFASGGFLDPLRLGNTRDGLYKYSKMRKADFLILTDVHGESDFALTRLALMAATDCKLPFVARVHGQKFEAAVDILTPPTDTNNSSGGWETIKSASLVNMILQSHSLSTKLDLPFVLRRVYNTVETEKKLYRMTAEMPLVAFDAGNHRYTHWEDFPVKG